MCELAGPSILALWNFQCFLHFHLKKHSKYHIFGEYEQECCSALEGRGHYFLSVHVWSLGQGAPENSKQIIAKVIKNGHY